MQQVIQGFF